ncbi:FG-GAP-like repeat-containing protein [Puia sp. P3]|uniref:FG-GAP repeat domain-containing protein n=1 Tax=Puia sp. P3 TaxID=3423952 RepID=UPI003D673852
MVTSVHDHLVTTFLPAAIGAALTASAQPHFVKHILSGDFVSEGVAVADVNRDGKPDILAGALWFEAPAWTQHEITAPRHYDPATQFSNSFLDFAMDVNQDGWVDLIRISLPGEEAVWYQNPGNSPGHWPMHAILKNAGNESPAFVDVDGDGRNDILCNDPIAKEMIWMKAPVAKGDTTWTRHVIAGGTGVPGTSSGPAIPGTGRYTHGLGFADMNGDGRPDVIITKGWWEHPVDAQSRNWVFHPANLGEDCSQIYVLNGGKGRPAHDLVSASAHNYGIWWHEKVDTGWLTHLIFKEFSETHALAMADVNGDGHPDLVTGKRYFAHNGEDPGAYDASVLYWFEFRPGPSPMWIPHLIDSNSGVGLQVLVQDLDGNGTADIIVSNKRASSFSSKRSDRDLLAGRVRARFAGIVFPSLWEKLNFMPTQKDQNSPKTALNSKLREFFLEQLQDIYWAEKSW